MYTDKQAYYDIDIDDCIRYLWSHETIDDIACIDLQYLLRTVYYTYYDLIVTCVWLLMVKWETCKCNINRPSPFHWLSVEYLLGQGQHRQQAKVLPHPSGMLGWEGRGIEIIWYPASPLLATNGTNISLIYTLLLPLRTSSSVHKHWNTLIASTW